MNRAFSPHVILVLWSWGVAPCWDKSAPLALAAVELAVSSFTSDHLRRQFVVEYRRVKSAVGLGRGRRRGILLVMDCMVFHSVHEEIGDGFQAKEDDEGNGGVPP